MFSSYIEPVFRPPAEANSLILQITNGCSWNKCTYCEMYTEPQKKFSVKKEKDIINELQKLSQTPFAQTIKRIFLADGDALVLSTHKLMKILSAIQQYLPSVNRVGSYCLPKNLKNKSHLELTELYNAGLKIAYVGAESGNDLILTKINKGETYSTTVKCLKQLKKAGIKSSVMILNGMGGKKYSEQHAIHSAHLVNEAQPEFLSTLVISFPKGEKRLKKQFSDFEMLTPIELIEEMKIFIEHTELERTIFRSNHASNYLELKGTLGKSKGILLSRIDKVLNSPQTANLKPEWLRGL